MGDIPGVIGYVDRLSAAPGEQLEFKLSMSPAGLVDVRFVRIQSALFEPFGPGEKLVEVGERLHGITVRSQDIQPGSYGYTSPASCLDELPEVSLAVWVWPTLLAGEAQAEDIEWSFDATVLQSIGVEGEQGLVVRRPGQPDSGGYALLLDSNGVPTFDVWLDASRAVRASANRPVVKKQWSLIVARFSVRRGLDIQVLSNASWAKRAADAGHKEWLYDACPRMSDDGVLFGALRYDRASRGVAGVLSGKLDSPSIWHEWLSDYDVERLKGDVPPYISRPNGIWSAWDFGRDVAGSTFRDISASKRHGEFVNSPGRAVTGFNWNGGEQDFRHDPSAYGAAYFHPDDVSDVDWATTFTWCVPEDLPSGIYAAEVSGTSRDLIWFVVRPKRGSERKAPPIVVLLPTLTYLAYANNQLAYPDVRDRGDGFVRIRDPRQDVIEKHPEIGRSVYDVHSDGSGVCYASFRKPMIDNRPDYVTDFLSAGRHLAGDLYLVDWLTERGFEFDVVTDHDLHADGLDLIRDYKVVLTGSHPEYVTGNIIDALEFYGASGGNLMYLGGNGFFWVTSLAGESNHIMECRKGMSMAGNWKSPPGELHHSTSGELGGLWRHRGRGEHTLTAIGMASAGSGSRPQSYVRRPDSYKKEAEFVFRGVPEMGGIGDFGFALGGAAGDEIDRVDTRRGSPADTLILASAGNFDVHDYGIFLEDVIQRPDPAAHESLVRSDIALVLREDRGSVFSAGSISWSASLAHNRYDNSVSQITENVLRRFAGLEGG